MDGLLTWEMIIFYDLISVYHYIEWETVQQ